MNLLRRLKTLWKLSGVEIGQTWEEIEDKNILKSLRNIFRNSQAIIVEDDPLDKIV